MNKIDTIRYMGIKTNLLPHILPAIRKVTPENGTVLDLMAGSNAVAYALKEHFRVYANDIQEYSYVISRAIIVNQTENISAASAREELYPEYCRNMQEQEYSFFRKTYSDTYFSEKQCIDIDSLRYAIGKLSDPARKNLYLFALMGAMCKVQSTPGHFAQYMPATHARIIPLRNMDLLKEFYDKCDLYSDLVFTDKENKAFCRDYHELLNSGCCRDADTIYLDSPYTREQYSRFYHILETLVRYDDPGVSYKAKYRNDRFQSRFCYKSTVKDEFEAVFRYCRENSVNLVVSYSDRGLLDISELDRLAKAYFSSADLQYIDYQHSTQGKGPRSLHEVLLTCS